MMLRRVIRWPSVDDLDWGRGRLKPTRAALERRIEELEVEVARLQGS
jgi:hypothetical protein